jgi:hypothetical protein
LASKGSLLSLKIYYILFLRITKAMLVNINIYKHIDPHNYKILKGISPEACATKLFTDERC